MIQQMLRDRGSVSKQTFLRELEISDAQFKRDLAMLRDQFQKNISYDPATRAYRIGEGEDGPDIEMSGPMYTTAEIHAMLLMQDLVTQLQPGLLEQHLGPVRERLRLLLGSAALSSEEVRRRIRILHMASRPVEPNISATSARRRLHGAGCVFNTTEGSRTSLRTGMYRRRDWSFIAATGTSMAGVT
jgi:predicted DNA-binding transcriptional regulator YafY